MNTVLSGILLLGMLGQPSVAAEPAGRLVVPAKLVEDPGLVPNASFEDGQNAPTGWKLEGGRGAWADQGRTGKRTVSVTGGGRDSSYWRCTDLKLEPRTVYRFTGYLKTSPGTGGGCLITGPSSNNRDYSPTETWSRRGFVFVTPDNTDGVFLRVGQWQVPGTVFYDDVRLRPVVPIHAAVGGVTLGQGERITDGRYVAAPNLKGEGSNEFRGLISHTANFNSYRWVFGPGQTVTYEHRVGEAAQTSGKLSVTIGYYQSGTLHVEASKDGKTWTAVGKLGTRAGKEMTVPPSLYPTQSLRVRLRASGGPDVKGDSAPGNLQVYGYRYETALDRKLPDAIGRTHYLDVLHQDPDLKVTIEEIVGPESPEPAVSGRIQAPKDWNTATVRVTALRDGRGLDDQMTCKLNVRKEARFATPLDLRSPGVYVLTVAAGDAEGRLRFAARTTVSLPVLHAADYGDLIASDPRGDLWWCEGTHKISRYRAAPNGKGRPIRIVAAGNEYEPFQLVLRPRTDAKQVRVEMSDLTGPAGRIAKTNVTIDRVAWVHVHSPTDRVGCVGDWPDPLPPCDEPFGVPANTNQPIWITVYVPSDTKPGEYTGTVTVRADGGMRWQVPVSLRVLGFALPTEAHVFATFGFRSGNVRKYHNLKTDEELRQVYDLYMKNFAAHRISPYDPMALDPMRVTVETGLAWQGGQRVKDVKAAGTQSLEIVDDTKTGDVSASTVDLIPIDPQVSYTLRWKAKTAAPGQEYLVSVYHHTKAGRWIPYRNHDIKLAGSGEWQQCERVLRGVSPAEARYVKIVLRPARWTEKGDQTGTAWFDDVSFKWTDGGPELVKDPGFEVTGANAKVNVDFAAFDRAAERYLDKFGFTAFRLGVHGMGSGTFHSRHKGSIGGFAQGTPEYDALMKAYLSQVEAHLRQKGWLDKAYIYWFDEPDPKDYEFVKDGMAILKRSAPGLTRMLTEQPEPAMFGSVDLWCPLTASYSEKVCRERQSLGEHIMWYVCCGPREPYATLFIDHPAIDFRMWLWQTYKYDVEGILIWTTNYWTSGCAYPEPNYQNPWEDPMSYVSGYSTPVGTKRHWGNGDGRFIYPPNQKGAQDKTTQYLSGPVNSIRWEILREGIEDFEYLWQLRHAVRTLEKRGVTGPDVEQAKRLTVIPDQICKSLTEFTWDPKPLYEHRLKVGLALEGLLKKHGLKICTKRR